jgi:benzoyl-CoA reductase/2-hydroxyglutaryl-CoA dehydratase subunit BcrC/BadD/HgdB
MAAILATDDSVDTVRLDAEALARAAATSGAKICGYLTPLVPVELIAAAGFQPMLMSAGNAHETPLADRYMENLFDPQVRGVFERLLLGDFDYLSAIVLPRGGDSVHRLYYYLCELGRTHEAKFPPVLLTDVVQTPSAASASYTLGRVRHLWDQLRQIGTANTNEDDLSSAIIAAARQRSRLEAFARRRASGEIAAFEALAIFAAARMLPNEDFQKRLESVKTTGAPKGPRLVIAGSPHDDAGLHGAIKAAGGVVVGDFHAGGELSLAPPIASTGDPLEAIAAAYAQEQWGSRSFAAAGPALAAFASARKADAVVFSYFAVEEALTWDFPEQRKALEAAGIATLRLPDQARPYGSAAAVLGDFVRGLGSADR